MDRGAAMMLAGRIAARFPGARIGEPTLEEWAGELGRLDPERGDKVLEWLSNNLDRVPSFKQIRFAIGRVAIPTPPSDAWKSHELRGQNDPCDLCGQPVTNDDSGSWFDRDHDRWHNLHHGCHDAQKGAGS